MSVQNTIRRRRLALVAYAFAGSLLVTQSNISRADTSAQPTQRLTRGDYRNTGLGVFRRIIVSQNKTVTYDIWRAARHGTLEHLHFAMISPAPYPIESDTYRARSSGRDCGYVSLRLYPTTNGELLRDVLIVRYDGIEQPLTSGGRPLTGTDLSDDQTEITEVARSARDPHFYDTLNPAVRAQLRQDVPQCR